MKYARTKLRSCSWAGRAVACGQSEPELALGNAGGALDLSWMFCVVTVTVGSALRASGARRRRWPDWEVVQLAEKGSSLGPSSSHPGDPPYLAA